MTTQHTPGPLSVDSMRILAAAPRGNSLKYPVAYMNIDTEGLAAHESAANARLIAAAPVLLAALKKVYSTVTYPAHSDGSVVRLTQRDLNEVSAAIAAAEKGA